LLTAYTLVTLQSLKALEVTASNIFGIRAFLAVPQLPPHGHVLKDRLPQDRGLAAVVPLLLLLWLFVGCVALRHLSSARKSERAARCHCCMWAFVLL